MALKRDSKPEIKESRKTATYEFEDIDFSGTDDTNTELEQSETVNNNGSDNEVSVHQKKTVTAKKKPGRPKGSITKDPKEKAQHFSTSLPPELIRALNEQATKEDRPVSKIVARALKLYIDNN